MSLRFRRRIKIIPGVHLNISQSGISTSVGMHGASMTFGKRGTYTNVGLPGTGISWRTRVATTPAHVPEVAAGPPLPVNTVRTHHLHWWKIMIFIGTMLIAGATKSNGIIGAAWLLWFGYWLFLFLRLIVRSMKSNLKQSNGPTN